jgi:hypothetical protein
LRPRLGAALLLLLLIACTTWPAFAALLDTRFYYVHRLHAGLDPRFHQLMEHLQDSPAPGARVLFESTRRRWLMPDGNDAALEALVPVFTHRGVIGLGHPNLTRRDPDLTFQEGQLAGRHFATWTSEEFRSFLQHYDIATVVAWSHGAGRFLSGFPDILRTSIRISNVQVYDVVDWQSMLAGKATVRVGYDRIEIRDAHVEQIVLPYHWTRGMQATPAVPISPVTIAGVPAPLLGIQMQGHRMIILRQ